jgi:hypothetical protein
MSAQAFCGGVSSSAFNGVKRVISSARLSAGLAIRAATPKTTSHFFIFLSLTGADFRRIADPDAGQPNPKRGRFNRS